MGGVDPRIVESAWRSVHSPGGPPSRPAEQARRYPPRAGSAALRSPHLVFGTDTELPDLEMFEAEDFQPALYQAAGALHERQGWAVDDAIALIRAQAYAEERSIAEVAEDVVSGRLWTAC